MEMILKSKGKEYTVLYDDEDHELINQYVWHVHTCGYARANIDKRLRIYERKNIYMHRLIMDVLWNPNIFIDHKNHNGLDNRKSNIRLCTIGQNNSNTTTRKGSSSVYLGVSFCKDLNKWEARISGRSIKNTMLGYFDNEENAAMAYDAAAIRLYGAFANPNFKQS